MHWYLWNNAVLLFSSWPKILMPRHQREASLLSRRSIPWMKRARVTYMVIGWTKWTTWKDDDKKEHQGRWVWAYAPPSHAVDDVVRSLVDISDLAHVRRAHGHARSGSAVQHGAHQLPPGRGWGVTHRYLKKPDEILPMCASHLFIRGSKASTVFK